MSAHTLAWVVLVLLVLRVGMALGMPARPRPTTNEEKLLRSLNGVALGFLVWLLVAVLT